mmetsp:Transcript_62077/g.156729  ORF Transcript_62077/g.156729 Transcript_62077/m.156729 type:complete len:205 (-) Transcript_62077:887-1501(-)
MPADPSELGLHLPIHESGHHHCLGLELGHTLRDTHCLGLLRRLHAFEQSFALIHLPLEFTTSFVLFVVVGPSSKNCGDKANRTALGKPCQYTFVLLAFPRLHSLHIVFDFHGLLMESILTSQLLHASDPSLKAQSGKARIVSFDHSQHGLLGSSLLRFLHICQSGGLLLKRLLSGRLLFFLFYDLRPSLHDLCLQLLSGVLERL